MQVLEGVTVITVGVGPTLNGLLVESVKGGVVQPAGVTHPVLAAGVLTDALVMIGETADTLKVGLVTGKPPVVPTGVETFTPLVVTV